MIVPKYKIHVLEANVVRSIFVFYGYYEYDIRRLNDMFRQNPRDIVFNVEYSGEVKELGEDFIFSEEEMENIRTNDINVLFVNLLINMDDNIQNIKNKLFLASQNYPVEEMYLMSKNENYETLGLTTQPFKANPYEVQEEIPFILTVSNKCITKTTNNNIYVCYAKDVLGFVDAKFSTYIESYYPFLLNAREDVTKYEPFYRSVDMFYDVYQNRKKELNYVLPLFGYKKLDFVFKKDRRIPLQSIFNISHSTEKIPLIKFNTMKISSNIFRLYSKNVSTDGRKIPVLPFSLITKINNYIEKTPSVCYFIKKDEYIFLFQLMENASMRIYMEFQYFTEESRLIAYAQECIKEVFEPLAGFFKKTRIEPPIIENLKDVEVNSLEYQSKIQERVFDISDIISCVSKIFIIEKITPSVISLRYKRVSNFNIQSSKEAYVINNTKQGTKQKNIISGLMENYEMERSDAVSFYEGFVYQMKAREKVKKKEYRINNPGPLINIEVNKIENNIIIHSNEVTDVKTIEPLFIIIDSIIRIKKEMDTNYPIQNINALCSVQIQEPVAMDREIEPEKVESEVEDLEDLEESEKLEEIPEDLKVSEKLEEIPEDLKVSEKLENGAKDSEREPTLALTDAKQKNILRFLDSDSDSDSDSESEQIGGGEVEERRRRLLNDKEFVKGVSELNLNNYFKTRMEGYDKTLFANDKPDGKYRGYTSTCQSHVRRQPVILRKKELEDIKTTHPDFLKKGDVLEYTSNEGEDFYYICPRYWCLLDNSVMTQEEVDSGQCGKVIPHDNDNVPEGHYVYEFYHPDEHNSRENYVKHGPGISNTKGRDTCLPCCFKKWTTPRQIDKINECRDKGFKLPGQIETKVAPKVKETRIEVKERRKNSDVIIKSPEKFPLDEFTWGYLPTSVELFFGEFNIDCQESRSNTNLKTNHTCILRHGVENSKNKSFLACISDIKNMYNHNGKIKNEKEHSVENMVKDMVDSLTLDLFITLQNGSLIEVFSKTKREIDFTKYNTTEIYSKLFSRGLNEETEEYIFFIVMCTAYENYIDFLKEDNYIDYTYTWDLISKPNEYIFINGVNLIIFELIDNDNTNKIELLCPTNHYSGEFYDVNKKCVIILKSGTFFEPLYMYKSMSQYRSEATAYFDTKRNSTLSQKFKDVLTKIVKHRLETCKPLPSLNVYTFKPPILLTRLINILKFIKCEITNQVVNLKSKVIGLAVKYNGINGFIPCFPSSIIPYSETYPYHYVFITDFQWNTYENTVNFLTSINEAEKSLHCDIFLQIVEEEHVVGFLTNTNQFVQIDPPINVVESNQTIETLESYNHNEVDASRGEDNERVEYVKKIKTESELERLFFSYFIFLLNEPTFKDILTQIVEMKIDKASLELKLREIGKVKFAEEFDIHEIRNCFINDCEMTFPKLNLINNTDNEIKYYKKLSDYLTRYQSIIQNLQNPNSFLIFNPAKLTIHRDELYIMQQLLTKEYFENLEAMVSKHTDYDNAEPIIKKDYDNEIDFQKMLKPAEIVNYIKKSEPIHSVKWKKCFPSNFTEVFFQPAEVKRGMNNYDKNKYLTSCTYTFVLEILRTRGEFNENDISRILYEEYINNQMLKYIQHTEDVTLKDIIDVRNKPPIKTEYLGIFTEYFNKVIDLLKNEGKNGLAKLQLQKKIHPQVALNNMINDDNYFLSIIDLWLIFKHVGISAVFISSFIIKNMEDTKRYNFTANIVDDNIVFVVLPGLGENKVPTYKYISNDIFVSRDVLLCDIVEEPIDFTDFLVNYKIQSKTEYKKKRVKLIEI